MKDDRIVLLEQFVEEWVLSLPRDDKVGLLLLLCFHSEMFNFTKTKAAEFMSIMIGRSERTGRQWKSEFDEYGEISESCQGKYQRSGILWSSEELNDMAAKFVCKHGHVKVHQNMTSAVLCLWVNDGLLPQCHPRTRVST